MWKQRRASRLPAEFAVMLALASLAEAQFGSAIKDRLKRQTDKLTHSHDTATQPSGDPNRANDPNNEIPGTFHNPVPVIKDIVISGSDQYVSSAAFRVDLFAIQKQPELLTEAFVDKFVETQVQAEQSAYNFITSPKLRGEVVKRYEYQTYLGNQPNFANTALLRTFLYPQPDWSWMKDRPQDDSFILAIFLYSQDKITGREPAFVARELAPFTKQTLLLASKHAPRLVWNTLPLPDWKYDPNTDSIRFLSKNIAAPFLDEVDPLQAAPNEAFRGVKDVPHKTEYESYYTTALINQPKLPEEFQPGHCPSECLTNEFREKSTLFANGAAKFPSFGLLILDHKTSFKEIKVHSAEAEALSQAHTKIHARLMLGWDDIAVAKNVSAKMGQESFPTLAIYARVKSIDFVDDSANVISSIPGSELQTGSVFAKTQPFVQRGRPVPLEKRSTFGANGNSMPHEASRPHSTAQMTPEQQRQAQQNRMYQARLQQCQRYAASRYPDANSDEYKTTYGSCVAKISANGSRGNQ